MWEKSESTLVTPYRSGAGCQSRGPGGNDRIPSNYRQSARIPEPAQDIPVDPLGKTMKWRFGASLRMREVLADLADHLAHGR